MLKAATTTATTTTAAPTRPAAAAAAGARHLGYGIEQKTLSEEHMSLVVEVLNQQREASHSSRDAFWILLHALQHGTTAAAKHTCMQQQQQHQHQVCQLQQERACSSRHMHEAAASAIRMQHQQQQQQQQHRACTGSFLWEKGTA
ncbi:hypothetical protein ACSSS7_005606 [Eimeria intestinalis]